MIEISVRLISSIFIDSNLIFYGTRFRNKKTNKKNPKITKKDHTVKYHENTMNGYTKYYPYEKKRHNNYIDQYIEIGNIYRTSIENLSKAMETKIYRTSVENRSKIYRKSMEHLQKCIFSQF